MVRVLIVDDSLLLRERLCCRLGSIEGIEIAGKAGDVVSTVAPVAGGTWKGAFSCTVCASTIAATNRISPPPEQTAWPAVSPCGAPKPIRPAAVLDATVPPPNRIGFAPMVA